jgi:hypothetical protein
MSNSNPSSNRRVMRLFELASVSSPEDRELLIWAANQIESSADETKALNATMSQEIQRAEWRHIHSVLRQAQQRIQAEGVRHSWMDGAIGIAEARAKGEGLSEEPTPRKPCECAECRGIRERSAEKAPPPPCGNPVMINSEWYRGCRLPSGHEGECNAQNGEESQT